jgi:hypothetical protein
MTFSKLLKLFAGVLPALAFVSCSGSGGGDDGTDSGLGTVNVALTDAASDEIDRFEVDVKAIDLVKQDGAVVHALPVTARVDFADLVELAELVNSAIVPAGTYLQAEITLDFTGAEIHIAGAAANATVLNSSGAPLQGTLKMKVELDAKRPLVVSSGLTRFLTIDFDLDASTSVDAGLNTVTVSPVLVAEVELDRHRIQRVRGRLVAVDTGSQSFDLLVRPFRSKESVFGTLPVFTNAETHFEINGVSHEGAGGMAALALLPEGSEVIAVGEFHAGNGSYLALDVLAGSSASGGTMDVVQGHVASRSGNTLTLIGTTVDRPNGTISFNANVAVELTPATTRVNRQFAADILNTGAVSVGQRITAIGTLGGTTGAFVLNPTQSVRLLVTKITGAVKTVSTGGLTLDVQRFDFRPAAAFNFTGTGAPEDDADPKEYRVVTGALNLAGIHAGSPVRLYGFVAPFGFAPPDFEAAALVDVSAVAALMEVIWKSDSDVQFGELGNGKIELDLSDSPLIHHVLRAGEVTDLTQLADVSLEADDDPRVIFAIKDGLTVTVHQDFTAFLEDLTSRLAGGKTARRLCALGHFNDATGELSARVASVVLKSASG